MNTRKWLWPIILCAILVLPLLLVFFHYPPAHHIAKPAPVHSVKGKDSPSKNGKSQKSPKPKAKVQWGVDSASKVDEAFLKCIDNHYGRPAVVGRYLETNEGTSTGLTRAEVADLHKHGIKIIPIFNHFTNAISYKSGVREAKEAIAYAKKIGIPKGTVIFADIEPTYPVDEGFIRGWVDTLAASDYKPGIYGVFTNNNKITSAYKKAIVKDKNVQRKAIIWSSNPDPGITKKGNAPAFKPHAPNNVKVSIWQYGMDGKSCNIDTNLVQPYVLPYLW